MKIKKLFLSAVVLFSFTGCCAYIDSINRLTEFDRLFAVEWNESVGTRVPDLKYGDGEYYNNFDLYLPSDCGSEKSRHLILFVHGGGWTSGSKIDGDIYCKYFTSKGYVTSSIDYTLMDGEHNPSISSINGELLDAVSAVKSAAHERGYDLVDMALFGFSAGACQVLLYAFKENARSALPVKFIMDWSGPTSLNPDDWTTEAGVWSPLCLMTGLDGTYGGEASLICKFSGQPCTADMVADGSARTIWESISPITYVTSSIPPVLLCYGSYDQLVPVRHQKLLIDRMKSSGLIKLGLEDGVHAEEERFYVIEFPNSGHSLCSDLDKGMEFQRVADIYCNRYFQ